MKRWLQFWPLLPVFVLYFHNIDLSSDSYLLVKGSQLFWQYAKSGSFPHTDIFGPFPPLQYLIALPLAFIGLKQGLIVRLLVAVNFAATLLLMRSIFRHFVRIGHAGLGKAFLLVMLSGMPLWFAHAPLGEALSTACISALILEFLEGRRPAPLLFWAFLSMTSKETALVFLCLLLSAAAFVPSRPKLKAPALMALAFGLVLGALMHPLWNEVRYGTTSNLNYLDPSRRVHEFSVWFSYLFVQFFSPTVGLLFVWPTFALAAALAFKAAITRSGTRLTALQVLACIGLMICGLAAWHTPTGAVSWGPRLLFPWLIPSLLILMHATAAPLSTALEKIRNKLTPVSAVGISVPLGLVSLPAFATLFGDHLTGYPFFTPDPVCPTMPVVQENAAYFYRCMDRIFWMREPQQIHVFRVTENPLAFAAALICAFIWCRELQRWLVARDS